MRRLVACGLGGAALIGLLSRVPAAWAAADTTPPATPVVTDQGAYIGPSLWLVAWWTSRDPESGIAQYQCLVRQASPAGPIVVNWVATRSPAIRLFRPRLQQGSTYYVGVKAQNRTGLWSAVGYSDGITIDLTAPTPVTVTDDGAGTASTTTLHAAWTASSDPESGVVGYTYVIRQGSSSGRVIASGSLPGTVTEVTRTGLRLVNGATYVIGVQAKNGANRLSPFRYSDGITVQADTIPPMLNAILPPPSPTLYAGDPLVLSASVTDTDPSPLEYQFSVDGAIAQPWSAAATYRWVTAGSMAGPHTLTVEVRDAGGAASNTQMLYLYMKPPGPP